MEFQPIFKSLENLKILKVKSNFFKWVRYKNPKNDRRV